VIALRVDDLFWCGLGLSLAGMAAFVVIVTRGTMTAQTKRNIESGLAVLVVGAFAATGFVSICWWLFCLIRETLP
jgi:hypothetical protein